MTQQILQVLHDPDFPDQAHLNLEDGETVAVGSKPWYDWLAANTSFHFDSGKLRLTARKHPRNSGDFWYGYRKLGNQLGSSYIGKTEAVTVAKLLEVAVKLAQPKGGKQLGRKEKKQECITDKLGNEGSSYAQKCLTQDKEQNDWYCRYQELLKQADLWREKAEERDKDFPLLCQQIERLESINSVLAAEVKDLKVQYEDSQGYLAKCREQKEKLEIRLNELREENAQLQQQVKSSIQPEPLVAVLRKLITPKSQGGHYAGNNAAGMKYEIESLIRKHGRV